MLASDLRSKGRANQPWLQSPGSRSSEGQWDRRVPIPWAEGGRRGRYEDTGRPPGRGAVPSPQEGCAQVGGGDIVCGRSQQAAWGFDK